MGDGWGGRAVMQARALVARTLPTACGKCGRTVDGKTPWVVGHKLDRVTHPHLIWEPTNWQPEHRACSDRSGQAAVIAKAQRDALASIQSPLFDADPLRVFPTADPSGKPPPLPVSLPATGEPIEARPDLAWSPDAMREHAWTAEFAEVPGDASPPLYMTPVPADAVGSYAAEPCECCGLTAVEWIEDVERKRLRWWQRLAVARQLEHRADGSLCHREILESCPRRAGKSVRLRGVALWRMKHGFALFGEVQTVVHTGNNLRICREIQRGAWRWAMETWGKDSVTKANGKEAIEAPEGDRWMVFAQDAVYGYDVTLGLGDECWDVKTDTVTEGLEPAMLERSSPQLHLTSTAHRRATSLMRKKIRDALLGVPDDETEADEAEPLLLVWAAPHGSDASDPEVWRAASPHWSEDRRRMIASKYRKALKGEVDPEADDPDPMAGFVAQYLNVWPMRPAVAQRGDPIATEHTWAPLAVVIERDGPPAAAAIESWFAAGVSLALAWRDDSGRALVAVTDHPDLAAAAAELRAGGFRGTVAVGKSLAEDPALKGIKVRKAEGRAGAAAGELARLMGEDGIRFEPLADLEDDHLTGQVLAARIVKSADGPRIVSTGRADALKALVWAATAARKSRRRRRTGLLLPTT